MKIGYKTKRSSNTLKRTTYNDRSWRWRKIEEVIKKLGKEELTLVQRDRFFREKVVSAYIETDSDFPEELGKRVLVICKWLQKGRDKDKKGKRNGKETEAE